MPGLVVNLVTETGGIDDGQGDASAFLIQFELCGGSVGQHSQTIISETRNSPTVTGLMRTPSSM